VLLHARHAFSCTRPVKETGPDTALDVVALDCEMIYSTGGVRVARVSVVDGMGKEVFDEIVKMDDGVDVM
jgi:RNA exonuclease 1